MRNLSEKSTAELVAGSIDDALKLVRKELELLRIGLTETLSERLKGAGLIGGAALAVVPGLLFVLVALALWLPGSAAFGFFVLGLALLAIAGAAVFFGVKLVRSGGKESSAALDKVKEDARWARGRLTR
ncbi:MAG: phage holin family protein [Actinomycetota bacterium]